MHITIDMIWSHGDVRDGNVHLCAGDVRDGDVHHKDAHHHVDDDVHHQLFVYFVHLF